MTSFDRNAYPDQYVAMGGMFDSSTGTSGSGGTGQATGSDTTPPDGGGGTHLKMMARAAAPSTGSQASGGGGGSEYRERWRRL